MNMRDIFLALTVSLIWGCNFVFAKYAVDHFGALMTMAIRLLFVGLCLMPFVSHPRISRKEIFKVSFVQGVLHHGFLFTALGSDLPVSTIAVLNQLNAPFSSILAHFWLNDYIRIRRLIGIVIAFSGILIVFGVPEVTKENIIGLSCAILGAFSLSISNIQVKRLGAFDPLPFLAWVSLMAAPFLGIASLILEPFDIESFKYIPASVYFSFAYMMISSIVGYGIWFRLLQTYSVSVIAPFTLLIPIFTILIASFVLGEQITRELIIGSSLTLVGVGIIILRRPEYIREQKI